MQKDSNSLQLQFSQLLLAVFAVLNFLPLDFPFRHTHEDIPRYHTDDHDVCRAAAWLFVILLAWYFVLLLSLIRTKHAIDSTWGQRLLIYPNLIIGVVGILGCIAVFRSFYSHSDEAFSQWMSFLNGSVLTVILVYNVTLIRNPLKERLRYAWKLLVSTSVFFLTVIICVSIYEYQWYVAGICAAILLPFFGGALELRSIATKEPYKF
eukprot:TRINITY_DN23061_c0_g1_i1.p1 TRINITY_DN23061_c0_g1~~TRINITY_DN23061_c0_g1_i1.p1  ORF type:complete len:208 (+),score=4.97 TRINITY_DN23061_c0_g1_i1:28-651(+)